MLSLRFLAAAGALVFGAANVQAQSGPICLDPEQYFYCLPGQYCLQVRLGPDPFSTYGHCNSQAAGNEPLTCDATNLCPSYASCTNGICVVSDLGPSARARARTRAINARRELVFDAKAQNHMGHNVGTKSFCSSSQRTCPLPSGNYECLELDELTSCGGCMSDNTGVDCLALPGVQSVQCLRNQCVAFSCGDGFTLNGGKCVEQN
ncbi:hypothetical protein MNV49_007269 [Pseudohyphozyma bogoriensis]|nr:hypothetical protein MNV49_007269 [Pseudohyphozyma bogoriensis]